HLDALATLVTSSARVRVLSIWDVDIADLLEGQPGPMHAGEAETSVMLHLYPDLVRMERARDFELSEDAFRRYVRDEMPSPPPGGAGVVGRPSLATAEKGARIYRRMLEAIQRAVFLPATATDTDTL